MKIGVALSGGIDSAVTAALLKSEGHEIIGLTAIMSPTAKDVSKESQKIAEIIGFPLFKFDFTKEFTERVVNPFCQEYLAGRTPNPCALCNAQVKFKELWCQASKLGCQKLATGHYARINKSLAGRYYISRAKDVNKDQSYFLGLLTQDILSDLIFPLGDYSKKEVREISLNYNLGLEDKEESQEICFIPSNDYANFIERQPGQSFKPGKIVDLKGACLGQHAGIHKYTIGQRRGLGIAAARPLYVLKIDVQKNEVVVGWEEDLEKRQFLVKDINYMKTLDLNSQKVLLKTRSNQDLVPGVVIKKKDDLKVQLDEGLKAITPGQLAVFYEEDDILAAGIIN